MAGASEHVTHARMPRTGGVGDHQASRNQSSIVASNFQLARPYGSSLWVSGNRSIATGTGAGGTFSMRLHWHWRAPIANSAYRKYISLAAQAPDRESLECLDYHHHKIVVAET